MALNNSKGNMYSFVTHTWNTVKGKCYHNCSYCYMKRWGRLKDVRFDHKELNTDLGTGNFIFVGSSNDLFAENIPESWIKQTLHHMQVFDCKYLLQTKNPARILNYIDATVITDKSVVCTTLESDIFYPAIMQNSPHPEHRTEAMNWISEIVETYVTIEPVMKFNPGKFLYLLQQCRPKQINIGADSQRSGLPEPTPGELHNLIDELEKFTTVHLKPNLKRLL